MPGNVGEIIRISTTQQYVKHMTQKQAFKPYQTAHKTEMSRRNSQSLTITTWEQMSTLALVSTFLGAIGAYHTGAHHLCFL